MTISNNQIYRHSGNAPPHLHPAARIPSGTFRLQTIRQNVMPENGCCVTIVMQHGETSEPAGRTSLWTGKHETTEQLLDKSSGLQQLSLDEIIWFSSRQFGNNFSKSHTPLQKTAQEFLNIPEEAKGKNSWIQSEGQWGGGGKFTFINTLESTFKKADCIWNQSTLLFKRHNWKHGTRKKPKKIQRRLKFPIKYSWNKF